MQPEDDVVYVCTTENLIPTWKNGTSYPPHQSDKVKKILEQYFQKCEIFVLDEFHWPRGTQHEQLQSIATKRVFFLDGNKIADNNEIRSAVVKAALYNLYPNKKVVVISYDFVTSLESLIHAEEEVRANEENIKRLLNPITIKLIDV